MEVVAAALREDVDLVYHSLRLIGADGRARRRGLSKKVGFPIRGEPLRHMALFGNPIPTSASLVRRRIFEHIGGMSEDPKLVAFEDFDAWLRLVERGARIHFIDEILGSYWIGDDSISAMSERQIYRQIELFNRHVSYFSAFEKAAQARQYYTIGSMWGQIKGQSEVAREHLSRAKALPTFAMRIKRLFKYIKLTF
jgi:GT2 family glycosyltransferase